MQDSLTGKIIAAAFKVYNKLGFGFIEKVYENARLLELRKQGLSAGQQVPLSVYYDEKIVGEFYLDLFVEEQVIVELKSVAHLHAEHGVQLARDLIFGEGRAREQQHAVEQHGCQSRPHDQHRDETLGAAEGILYGVDELPQLKIEQCPQGTRSPGSV